MTHAATPHRIMVKEHLASVDALSDTRCAMTPASSAHAKLCENPIMDDARPRRAGIRSSATSMTVGIAIPRPMQ
jgi:hypothetical protein